MDEIINFGALDSDNDDDMDEALIFHILNENKNLGNLRELYGAFDLNSLSETECRKLFRFEKNHLRRLSTALNLPELITTEERITVPEFCL
ncbi:unnamed protein product [Brassicogethes aeneus]|uniref:Uncharacterized protein n=1 Tax=Brassicogethes aeneus TaxID=1431903 RepID=A0A9P0BCY2_BRAAE|nr:unnamed protein product [Brassicogethes aeneus]